VAEQAQRLLAPAGAADPARFGLGEDLRALALINLGIAELWTARFEEADRHLEQGIALAHRIGRPFLEITGLAHWAQLVSWWSFPLGAQRGMQAIELAGRHGWTDEPVAGVASIAVGMAMVARGRLDEGERSLEHAERTVRAEVEPRPGGLHFVTDGHHRVSIAAATGQQTIDAYVTEILTTKPPDRTTRTLAA
jgi:LuxR family maltose regulon positive regulatory protein